MSELTTYEGGEFLTSHEAVAEYLNLALQDEDSAVFIRALGDAARARGMTEVANLTGIDRSTLYRCLSGNHDTGLSVIFRVLQALGTGLSANQRMQETS
jgi:probable addiction module antidote protein